MVRNRIGVREVDHHIGLCRETNDSLEHGNIRFARHSDTTGPDTATSQIDTGKTHFLDKKSPHPAGYPGNAYAHEIDREDRRRNRSDRAATSCLQRGWGGDITASMI